MTLRRAVVIAHRWIGVCAAILWLLQAATGLFCVFHWEIEDATVSGAHRPTDFHAIERRVAALDVHSIWTTAGAPDRYDVNVPGRSIRIDGAGNFLRVVKDGENPYESLVELHQSLFAGDRGRWIVGASGSVLLSNLVLGIVAAWPKRKQWSRALRPVRTPSRVATLYSWHRAAGLWFCVPALAVVIAGVLLAFNVDDPPETHFDIRGPLRLKMTAAIDTALARYPGSAISGIGFPSNETAIWTITLKQPGELQRAYGKTRVMISAVDGRLLAAQEPRPVRDHIFPFHTGEIAGLTGRIAVLAVGSWLGLMIVLGFALFLSRRNRSLRA